MAGTKIYHDFSSALKKVAKAVYNVVTEASEIGDVDEFDMTVAAIKKSDGSVEHVFGLYQYVDTITGKTVGCVKYTVSVTAKYYNFDENPQEDWHRG